jgi:hypothetical protein
MKKRYRMVPFDTLAVEKGDEAIIVATSGHNICMTAYDDFGKRIVESHEFTFDQFFALITKLKPGIQDDV